MDGMKYAVALALAVLLATPTWAQEVEITKPAPPPTVREPEPNIIPPGLYDETRPSDADLYSRGGLVRYDPAFIGPLSSKRETPTSTGRLGISGWTSPNTPVGPPSSGWNEVSGYFAFGLSFTWDGPPPARRPAPVP
jgi:hypothetical protein